MATLRGQGDLWLRAAEVARCALGAVTGAGYQVKHRPWQAFERGHRYYGRFALVLLTEGAGRYEDDRGVCRDLEPGDVVVVLPDVGHRYGPRRGHGWREVFIVFDGPVFERWRRDGLLRPDRPVLRARPVERWAERVQRVLEPNASTEADALVEVCRVQQLLAELLADEGGSGVGPGRSPWLERAVELVESTIPGPPVDWDEVAERLHVSPATLRRRFRERLGVPPGRYRTRRMIERGCELMQQTDLTDQQIADRLGFCDGFYFSRCFKRVTGRSPRAYRASLP